MKEADVLRVRDYLEHIELAIARIRRYIAGLDRAAFLAGEEKQDAVIRNIISPAKLPRASGAVIPSLRRATRRFHGAASMV